MTGTFTLHHDESKNKEGSAAVAEASKLRFPPLRDPLGPGAGSNLLCLYIRFYCNLEASATAADPFLYKNT